MCAAIHDGHPVRAWRELVAGCGAGWPALGMRLSVGLSQVNRAVFRNLTLAQTDRSRLIFMIHIAAHVHVLGTLDEALRAALLHIALCTNHYVSPPVLQLIVKRRAGGHGTSLKKSNLREDPIPPLPFALISLPESENMKRQVQVCGFSSRRIRCVASVRRGSGGMGYLWAGC